MSIGRHKIGTPSLVGAQALDSIGDPHLSDGIHFRLATGPLLGLPARPFDVYRLNLGRGKSFPGVRRELRWENALKRRIAPPFTLNGSNRRVVGFLPPPSIAQCCWIEVLTSGPENLRVDAVVNDAGIVASRTSVPFALTATSINRIEISGTGHITGVRWITVEDVWEEAVRRQQLATSNADHLSIWRQLALPVGNAQHYVDAVPNPAKAAFERVRRGGPKRMGLHDDPNAAGPANAKPFDLIDQGPKEEERVRDFADKLVEYVQQLVEVDNPQDLLTAEVFEDFGGDMSFDMLVLDAVLQNLIDPGVARFLGYSDVDNIPLSTTPNDVLAYVIAGHWERNVPVPSLSVADLNSVQLSTVACAVVGHPPDSPSALAMHKPISGAWLPAPPPVAIRHMTLPISGFISGAMVALARRDASGSFTSLNGVNKPSLRARGLLPNLEESPTLALTGLEFAEFLDKEGPPGKTLYRSAQHDWFGRWSQWAKKTAAAGVRPGPQVPVLQAQYIQPSFGIPIPLGLLAGSIRFEVPVPPSRSLAPASFLLDSLELDIDGLIQSVTLLAGDERITDDLAAPPVPRNGEVSVTLIARWVDTAGNRSMPSDPRTLLLRDPRPPLIVTFPPGLRYTARPDSRGRARFALKWNSQQGQKYFRVFYTDELRLIDGLDGIANSGLINSAEAQAALDQLDLLTDPAVRAQVFDDVSSLFARSSFEQLTDSPVAATDTGDLFRFEHDVAGDLEVLCFYRVVAISNAQVEASFEDSSMIPVRVPNSLVAPRPSITVIPRFNTAQAIFEAHVKVTVPPGNVRAVQYRLRRTIGLQLEPNSMPVVTIGSFGPPNNDNVQIGEFVDLGGSELSATTRLLPWHRYVWQVDVRGPQEIGAGPPARWSEPGGPVAHLFIPETLPAAPSSIEVESVTDGSQITVGYDGPINGGTVGRYILRIYRESKNAPPELAGRVFMDEVLDPGDGFVFLDVATVASNISYRAVVVDPIGRTSAASASIKLNGDDDG